MKPPQGFPKEELEQVLHQISLKNGLQLVSWTPIPLDTAQGFSMAVSQCVSVEELPDRITGILPLLLKCTKLPPEGASNLKQPPEGDSHLTLSSVGASNLEQPPEGDGDLKLPPEGGSNLKQPPEGANNLKQSPEGVGDLKLPQEGAYNLEQPPEGAGNLKLPPEGAGNLKLPPEGAGNLKLPPDGDGNLKLPPEGDGNLKLPPDGDSNLKLPPEGVGNLKLPPEGEGKLKLPPEGDGNLKLPPDGDGNLKLPLEGDGNLKLPPEGYGNLKLPDYSVIEGCSRNTGCSSQEIVLPIVLKSMVKPTLEKRCQRVARFGDTYYNLFKHYETMVFNKVCHIEKEICMVEYAASNEHLGMYFPRIYHTICDRERSIYAIFMECLTPENTLIFAETDLNNWTPDLLSRVLSNLASFHLLHLDNYEQVVNDLDCTLVYPPSRVLQTRPLSRASLSICQTLYPELYDDQITTLLHTIIASYETEIYPVINEAIKTIIHGDSYPGNLGLRAGACHGPDLVLVDWELTAIHVPQRDVILFLIEALQEGATVGEWCHYREVYRQALRNGIIASGQSFQHTDSINKTQNWKTCGTRMETRSSNAKCIQFVERDYFNRVFDYVFMEVLIRRVVGLGIAAVEYNLDCYPEICKVSFRYLRHIQEIYLFLGGKNQ